MHLQVVLAFALLLWWPDVPATAPWIAAPAWSAAVVWGKPVLLTLVAWIVAGRASRRLRGVAHPPANVLSFYHRAVFLIRLALLGSVAVDLFCTAWPAWLEARRGLDVVPGVVQLMLLAPYVVGLVAVWWVVYPVEHASREPFTAMSPRARRRAVIFNLRHQLLIVALPLSLIVMVYAATDRYRVWLIERLGSTWGPEAVLGTTAAIMFVLAPVLLRRIWATSPLPDGPLRRRLLAECERIGLRVREILIWHSDGLVVNAAVMGMLPRVRYILLSDHLLESMTDDEVTAVFGHEAGHVRYHHLQYFLLFAVVSMLICSGVMEGLLWLGRRNPATWRMSLDAVQAIGFASIAPFWGIAFGWVSRRFERQADFFGAGCVAAASDEAGCGRPCTRHDPAPQGPRQSDGETTCALGADVFVRALNKVALLNGIPPEERSWRHSSIASRMRFLTSLAGDPMMTCGFLRVIRRIKRTLLVCTVVGGAIAAAYIWNDPRYRQAVEAGLIEPLRQLFN